ncbi:O-antigen ligase family protein [Candidatus Pelagibacter bacterium nBUS_30]|uniref:O-antigen ligase family protein n=1 Tax=Candidatus Pelagibacter bacterium nBUS_30 TaxID=3374191 RepID=UPI003EB6CA54
MVQNNFSLSKKIIEIIFIILPITLLLSNALSELIILILILFYISFPKPNFFLTTLKNPLIVLLLIFWLYLIFNYLINYENNPSLERTIFFIRFPLLILSISFFINKLNIDLDKIFRYWMIIITIICVDIFFQFFTLKNIIGNEAVLQGKIYRLGGFMGEELKIANLIFHFGALVFSYFFLKKYSDSIKNNLVNILFLVLLVTTVFLTAERSNFVTIFFFSLLIIFFLGFKSIKLSLIILSIFSVMTVTLLVSNDHKQISKRMISSIIFKEFKNLKIESNKDYFNKDSHYFAHYSVAYQIYKKNKLFGVGLKNFRNYCDNDEFNGGIHPSFHEKKCSTHPHNFYLEILSEIGMIGLLLLISFFLFSFYIFSKVFIKTNDYYLIFSSFILLVYFVPFLPRGSFFTNWNAIIFWTVFAFIYSNYDKLKKF